MEKKYGTRGSFAKLPPERLREISSAGGRAAAAARRRKYGLRDALRQLMEKEGVQEKLAAALVREATDGTRPGNAVKAFEVIRKMLEETSEKEGMDVERMDLSALSMEELLGWLE